MTERKALGRGLDALFGDSKASLTQNTQTNPSVASIPEKGTQKKLSVGALQPSDAQPRRFFDDEAIANLANSIKEHGVLQPLLVRPVKGDLDKYEIIAGERRWRAAQKAQIHEVPVIIQHFTDKEAMEIALVENLQRQDLTAIEEAEGYQRLMKEFGHTQEKLADVIGKSRSHIANMLRLLNLPESVRGMVHKGDLSAGHARALLSAENPEKLAQTILNSKMSVRDIEKLVNNKPKTSTEKKSSPSGNTSATPLVKDSNTIALERSLSNQLGLKVEVKHGTAGAGNLTIHYQSLDQLDEVLHLLTHQQTL